MKRVFINASKNRDGKTVELAKLTLDGFEHNTIHLADYTIGQLGQQLEADEFAKVFKMVSKPDVLIIGTPVYFGSVSGYLKTFIDRLYDTILGGPLNNEKAPLFDADVYLVIQGKAPEDAYDGTKIIMNHLCDRFFMNFKGFIKNEDDAKEVNKALCIEPIDA